MLNDSERQTIQEVLKATKTHLRVVGEAINGESSFEKLRDVHEGMEISISKLETVLGDTAKVERDHKAVMKLIARTGILYPYNSGQSLSLGCRLEKDQAGAGRGVPRRLTERYNLT